MYYATFDVLIKILESLSTSEPKSRILYYMQRNSIIESCMATMDKLGKYEESLQGRCAFAIATMLDPKLKFNYVSCVTMKN